jgi:hypothetical protein
MGRLRSSFLNPAVLASDRLTLARIRFPRFKPGLRIKLLVVVVAISLIGILASSLLLLSLLREQFLDNAEASLIRSNQRL